MQQANIEIGHGELCHWSLQIRIRREFRCHDRWSVGYRWSLISCASDRAAKAGELNVEEYLVSDTCSDFLWRGLALKLFSDERAAYRFNINSGDPRLFVICNEDYEHMSPFLITASQDEAASYMDGGEEDVFSIVMPTALQCWIEAFIARHGEPDVMIGKSKRRDHGKREDHNKTVT